MIDKRRSRLKIFWMQLKNSFINKNMFNLCGSSLYRSQLRMFEISYYTKINI